MKCNIETTVCIKICLFLRILRVQLEMPASIIGTGYKLRVPNQAYERKHDKDAPLMQQLALKKLGLIQFRRSFIKSQEKRATDHTDRRQDHRTACSLQSG